MIYEYTLPYFSSIMGSVQKLDNGNLLIGTGGSNDDNPDVIEVNCNKEIVMEMNFLDAMYSYRARKF